ncbi:MAG: type II toxin-antitoxin system VapC family toxin [Candidatus Diapherotrites archaeon]
MKYIDTNIFGYAIENSDKYGKACTRILEDIENGKLKVTSSQLTLIEMIGVIQKINSEKRRQKERELDLPKNMDALMSYPIAWQDTDLFTIKKAATYENTLFGADRIHLATMELNDVKEIISADTDFDKVQGIKRIDPLKY